MMKNVQCIVVKDFSRLGRDYLEIGNYLEHIFPLLQVRFSLYSKGMTGGMNVAFQNLINMMYSRDLSKKVRSARETRVKRGEYISPFTKYGYQKVPEDKHRIIIDPEAADVVKKIFHLAAEGNSIGVIVRYLNENKIPTCSEYKKMKGSKMYRPYTMEKKSWCTKTIRLIISDEIYLGKTIWNRSEKSMDTGHKMKYNDESEWIVVEDTHESIISKELFEKANNQLIMKKRGNLNKVSNNQVIFICGKCGRALSDYGKKNYKIFCRGRFGGSGSDCRDIVVNLEELEQSVLAYIRQTACSMLEQIKYQKSQETSIVSLQKDLDQLKMEKKKLSSQKMSLYDDYRSDKMNKEAFISISQRITERISETQQQVDEIEVSISVLTNTADREEKEKDLLEIKGLEVLDKRILFRVLKCVKVYSAEEIEIVWKTDDFFDSLMAKGTA